MLVRERTSSKNPNNLTSWHSFFENLCLLENALQANWDFSSNKSHTTSKTRWALPGFLCEWREVWGRLGYPSPASESICKPESNKWLMKASTFGFTLHARTVHVQCSTRTVQYTTRVKHDNWVELTTAEEYRIKISRRGGGLHPGRWLITADNLR